MNHFNFAALSMTQIRLIWAYNAVVLLFLASKPSTRTQQCSLAQAATMASGLLLPLYPLPPKSLYSVRPRFLSSRFPSYLSFTSHDHSISLNAASLSSLPELQSTLIDIFQASPPTWKSAIGSNLLIFILGSPILASGLSISGIGAAFLLGSLTWRAFGSSGFLLVASYFVLVSWIPDLLCTTVPI